MGKPFLLNFTDLGGGLNEGAADSIADREASVLENLYPVGKTSLWQTRGTRAIALAYSERINAIARYNPAFTPEEFTIIGADASIARLVGNVIQGLSIADGRVYPSIATRWWFRQYNDEMFAARKGNGGPKRIYGDSIMEAGIASPTLQPKIADGGAGQKAAGEYWLAYTFFNTITGAESNLSPISLPVTIGGNHQLAASSIGISPSLEVNARRIYVTLPDDEGTFSFVGQINDNVTTTFIENAKAPDDYGALYDGTNGLPPDQAFAIEVGGERLWVVNALGLFWSELGRLQGFKASSYTPVSKDDGYEPTGLKWWEDHGLVVTKPNLAMLFRGNPGTDGALVQLSGEHGSPAGQSIVVADGVLYYYTGTNFVRSDGGAPQIIPNVDNVRETINSIPDANKGDVQGEVLPERKWIVWTVQTPSGRRLVIYDYGEGVWAAIPDAPYTIKRLIKTDQSEVLLAAWATDNILSEFLTGSTDNGQPISCTWRSKAFSTSSPGIAHSVRRVSLLTPQTVGQITVRVINEIDGVTMAPRTVSLNRPGWKRIAVVNAGQPGFLQQIEIAYAGTVQLKLNQVQVEGVELPRRVGRIL